MHDSTSAHSISVKWEWTAARVVLQQPFATLQQTAEACITDTMHHIIAISGVSNHTAETEANEHQIDTASMLLSLGQQFYCAADQHCTIG